MTTYAARADDVGTACCCVEGDGLVPAVHTGNVASAAADALLAVEDGKDDGVAVQVAGLDKVWQLLTHER